MDDESATCLGRDTSPAWLAPWTVHAQIINPDTLVLGPGEGESIILRGNRILLKAARPERHALADHTAPGGVPRPVHPGFDEDYVVLEARRPRASATRSTSSARAPPPTSTPG